MYNNKTNKNIFVRQSDTPTQLKIMKKINTVRFQIHSWKSSLYAKKIVFCVITRYQKSAYYKKLYFYILFKLLLTGLEPRLGQIVQTGDRWDWSKLPKDHLDDLSPIKRIQFQI